MSRRLAAILALTAGAAAIAAGAYAMAAAFPRGLLIVACLVAALGAAWLGLLRRGWGRTAGLLASALLVAGAVALMATGGRLLGLIAFGAALAICVVAARRAFRAERSLPAAPRPRRPVLFVNPRSGEGKPAEAGLSEAARERGIETIELGPEDDLRQLAEAAVGRGADALAMAGGDGCQSIVAAIAAEHDLPYACVPAGTRNHFALDLGVDREDVVGALDALVDGGERYVDLAEVNGHVFVNNVSLGVYAQAVSEDSYRDAKLRTLLDTFAETLGPEGEAAELRWHDGDGEPQVSVALVLVSNDPYRLGPTLGSGTRPRLDRGLLGILDFHPPAAGERHHRARWRQLELPELEIESDEPEIAVGVDGESLKLRPPLRFRSRPQALRVRIAHHHPGASPSAEIPRNPLAWPPALLRIAVRSV